MRTTLTIDDDVAKLLDEEVKRSGGTFKGVVNRWLRQGAIAERRPEKSKQFEIKARPLGSRPGLNYDSMSSLLDEAEGPFRR